ncbi:ParB N-terminal domain-containing protein [Anaeromyxobacter oryzae]|uniref:ParB/Sulfiredoxin domain-containing protein n=1 Tax=Anaeromyxobacter oryzae TaxID=2918170 RepID=A0ABN6MVL2_9BACT|nr:hypothetical protein [Anaeromyxobacter oryzae]BDG04955.1 hypothetical protein AMOR_39510 [Anaeromyxobacter oryzae]
MTTGEVDRYNGFEVHPAAGLFPEMESDELRALADSIREYGVRVPLVFHGGKLLDGRNRARASYLAGIAPKDVPRRSLDESIDPYQYAWDLNCSRLDYSPAQKAAIRIKVNEASGELQRAQEEAEERANRARAEKAKGNDNAAKERPENSRPPHDGPLKRHRDSPVAKQIAQEAHVSPRTVERVMKLKREEPEKFERVVNGRRNLRRSGSRDLFPAQIPKPARRSPKTFAAFLRERIPSTDCAELARLLTPAPPDTAAAE